jgi:ABC-type amino acid transport substrate-binding protein
VQGAALADATMMSGFDVDITRAVADGALVEVDTAATPPVLRVLP